MLTINKDERDYLVSMGAKHHKDVFKTRSKSPTYYCKEADWLLKLLKDKRNANKV